MTTPTWLTGFEYGLATPSVNGAGLIDAIVGNCAIQSGAHTGSYGLKCTATAAVLAYVSRNMTAGRTFVGRVYIYLPTLPATDRIIFSITTVGHKIQITYDQSINSLALGIDGAVTTPASSTCVIETWYCIDIKADTSANPWLTDWQIDSVAQTQNSYAHAAEDMSVIDYGIRTVGAWTAYYDDVVHSVTAADYPIGPGGTIGLRPDVDGTHNNAANVLEDSAGNDINGTTYPAWNKEDEKPWTSGAAADYVRQQNTGVANYCEIQFEDMTAVPTIIGVEGLLEYAASGTTANEGACIIRDGATETTVWGSPAARADYSETSAYYKHAIVAAASPPHTYTSVNAIRCRFGYSNNVTTKPYWLAIMLEVAYAYPPSSVLETNAAVMIEITEFAAGDIRQTNAALMIEESLTQDDIRMTNAALMIEIVLDTTYFHLHAGPKWQMPP